MSSPPEVRAQPADVLPSEWSPRPVPRDGVGRTTADPVTPTLAELAERERQRESAVTPAPARAPEPGSSDPTRQLKPLPSGTCGGGWGAVDAERDRVLASGGPTDNAIQRNVAISASYARYYQRNPNNEWAGLAAIVSRQAGCAMEHARDSMGPVNYDYCYRQLPEMQQHMPMIPPEPPTPGPVALGAMTAYDALAKTNKLIFSDIYPVLRFEEDYGADALDRCGASRSSRPVSQNVRQAVRQVRSEDPELRQGAGELMADYEQRQVLQKQVLNDWPTRTVFDANQRMADTRMGRWLGAEKPEVALSAGCRDGTPTVPFDGQFVDGDRRVAYYTGKLVPAFERLSPERRAAIINGIAGRGP